MQYAKLYVHDAGNVKDVKPRKILQQLEGGRGGTVSRRRRGAVARAGNQLGAGKAENLQQGPLGDAMGLVVRTLVPR